MKEERTAKYTRISREAIDYNVNIFCGLISLCDFANTTNSIAAVNRNIITSGLNRFVYISPTDYLKGMIAMPDKIKARTINSIAHGKSLTIDGVYQELKKACAAYAPIED